MTDDFKLAMKFTEKWEGGYTKDPQDPGGETKYGISKKAYPLLDIKNLTIDQAYDIYYKDYWLKASCDKYDLPLACSLFDASVNVGVKRALGWLETSSGVDSFNQHREDYYTTLVERKPTLKKFFKGWMNRLNSLKEYIHGL